MITGTSETKKASAFVNGPGPFKGVGTIKIVAINPDNNKLRTLGWTVPEDAEEPNYVTTTTLEDGKTRKSARVRFMVELQEPDDKPIIPMDFWIRPESWLNKEGNKCQVIDCYGRTAWATKEELKADKIPQYSSGPAKISLPYKPSHKGQEEIVNFLMRYLVCTPFESYDKKTDTWKKNDNPGTLTIDNWADLSNGNARELASYVALQPDNLLKVIFGVQKTEDNRVFQTFITTGYLPNNARLVNGEYTTAVKLIDKVMADGYHDNCEFSASPIVQYTVTPTEVTPPAPASAQNVDVDALFEEGDADDDSDLPFDLG